MITKTQGTHALLLLGWAMLSAACVSPRPTNTDSQTRMEDGEADRRELTELVDRAIAETRAAWEARDARRMLPGDPDEEIVHTPDGRALTRGVLVADIQRRMNMTKAIDTMTEVVEKIEIDGDRAEVYTRQYFSRVMLLPDGAERRRISTVIHKRTFQRDDDGWGTDGPLEEISPRAWWEGDEPPTESPPPSQR